MNSVKFCSVEGVDSVGRVLLAVLEGRGIFGGHLRCFGEVLAMFGGAWHFEEGRGILEEVLAVVLEGCGIFGGRCLERRGILEEVLAVFWRGVAFLLGACSVLEGCLQCF